MLNLEDKIPFGKWKDTSIKWMLDKENFEHFSIFGRGNPISYLKWWNKTVEQHPLSKEVLKAIETREKEDREFLAQEQRIRINEEHLYKENHPTKKSKNTNHSNRWENLDERELGMSISDYGYDGDGW